MKVYLVGGAVRDRLLGLPVAERDWVVVGATAGQMLAAGYRRADADFTPDLHEYAPYDTRSLGADPRLIG